MKYRMAAQPQQSATVPQMSDTSHMLQASAANDFSESVDVHRLLDCSLQATGLFSIG